MLPFSDAKEGPLSTLTLSGQRTMTTYASGLEKAADSPAQAIEKGLGAANNVLEKVAFNPAIEPIPNDAAQMAEDGNPKPTIKREPVKKVSSPRTRKAKTTRAAAPAKATGRSKSQFKSCSSPSTSRRSRTCNSSSSCSRRSRTSPTPTAAKKRRTTRTPSQHKEREDTTL